MTHRATPPLPPNNLPRQPAAFVGRDAELALIAQYLADPDCRLLSLVGAGGTGKTRLALEAAARHLPEYPDGVFLVRLEALSEVAFIAPTIANALGLALVGHQDPAVQVIQDLGAKQLLLVLDNFEHLLAGADLLGQILDSCPRVTLLLTTREPSGLAEEWVLALGGLPLPRDTSLDALEQSSAGQLFIQWARRLQAGFTLTPEDAPAVQRICRMVGGLPLGIQLAAAWVKIMSCAEIAEEIERSLDFLNTEMRGVPERHRSVRAVIESSWQLLTPRERRVFHQSAVFRGGFDRAAAARVTGATPPVLAGLIDKSLLYVMPGGRYERHLLVWQFAREKLEALPEELAQVQERHAVYYAGFLEQRAETLRGSRPQEAVAAIAADIENVRLAWHWILEHGRLDELAQSMTSLEIFYDTQGWYQEGAEAFEQAVTALRAPDPAAPDPAVLLQRGRVLARHGAFLARQGRLTEAETLLHESLAILRPLEAHAEIVYALGRLGAVVAQRGEYVQAKQYHQESLVLARAAGDRWGMMHALNALGLDASKLGDVAESRQRYHESLALARELGDRRMVARTLNYLGYMLSIAGEPAEAEPLLAESLTVVRELGDQGLLPYVLGSLGQVAYALGQYDTAGQHTAESLALATALGDRMLMTYALLRLGDIAGREHDILRAREHYLRGLRTAMEIAAVPRALGALIGLAQVRAQTGDAAGGLELLAHPLYHPATEQSDRERAVALADSLAATLGLPAGRPLAPPPLVPLVESLLGLTLPQSLASLLTLPAFEVTLDPTQQAQQVEEITDSEVFALLRAQAAELRRDLEAAGRDS